MFVCIIGKERNVGSGFVANGVGLNTWFVGNSRLRSYNAEIFVG